MISKKSHIRERGEVVEKKKPHICERGKVVEKKKPYICERGKVVEKKKPYICERGKVVEKNIPSLVDICVEKAIDNLRQIGNVGDVPDHLLERFLPHCTVEQLTHIEDATEGVDLSQVTDKLWKKFYEQEFGANSTNLVVERMKQKKVSFKWRQLYEAKQKDMEEAQQRSFDRIKQLYKTEDAKKRSRQVRICTKVPPTSSKRSFFGGGGPGSSVCNSKSNLMKKARLEVLNRQRSYQIREVKNLTAMRRNTVQTSNYRSSSAAIKKPGAFSSKGSGASTSNWRF